MRRRATQWPPANETATNRQGKVSHLLRVILDNCESLNDWEREFVDKMGALLNRRRGIEPATALTEKQARTLRKIIFKRHRDYKHALPSLPAGVKFEDEVRRLLKSQPNPNQVRNELIQLAQPLIEKYADPDGEYYEDFDDMGGTVVYEDVEQEVSYVRTVKDGNDAFLIFNIKHSGGYLPESPRWDQEINEEFIVAVRVDPKFFDKKVLEKNIKRHFHNMNMEDFPSPDMIDIAIENARWSEENQ